MFKSATMFDAIIHTGLALVTLALAYACVITGA